MNALEKITKARSLLVLDHPFFGSLALRLRLIEDNSFETTSVDGTSLSYNPEFIDSLSVKETSGLVAHEVMHLALGHNWRIDDRNCQDWNIAGDYAINTNLITAGFTLPKGHLTNPAYDNLSTEEVYLKIHMKLNKEGQGQEQPQQENQDQNKKDPGKCGSVMPTKSKTEAKEQKASWKAAVSQAIQISKGNLPADLQRQVQEVLDPPQPWYVLLRDFVEKSARNDYDWTRPNRRYIAQGIILPSLISEQLPEIIIAIDTSGSIDEKALSRFAAEASNVLGVYDTTIQILYCDTKVHKGETFTRADMPMKLNPVGGGGTDFCPVFDLIKKEDMAPACLIYFTDMYGRFPKKEPEYPTMWLSTSKDKKAPFGMTVEFN